MATLHTFSPEEVLVLLAGVIPVDGYINGTFISIKKNVQPFVSRTSSDGVVSRLYNNNQNYTVDLTLASYSTSNDILTKLWLADEVTQRAKFPILIKDLSGSTLFAATTCWIDGIPDVTLSNEITSRTWSIFCTQATYNIGGNDDASSLIEDLANAAIGAIPGLERTINNV